MDVKQAGWLDGAVQLQLEAYNETCIVLPFLFLQSECAVARDQCVSYNLIHIISCCLRALLPFKWIFHIFSLQASEMLIWKDMTEKFPVSFEKEIIHISYKEEAPDLHAAEFIIFRTQGKVCLLFFSL